MTDRLTDDTGGEVCEVCDRHVPDNVPVLFWCNVCEQVLCDDCWDLQPVHRKKTTHRTKVKTHERTELKIADLILSIFSAGRDVEEQLHGHENNLDTKWFGVISSDDEQLNPQLYNFERFRALIYGSFVDSTNQFPSLISFVGDTGAGKSTLINALIKTNAGCRATDESQTVPVMGQETGTPTSGDVHLFSDPDTYSTGRPILYSDCEGLDGGNNPAEGSLCKKMGSRRSRHMPKRSNKTDNDGNFPRFRARDMFLSQGQNRSHQWVVNNLYPTILFTFSDVICFVTKSIKKIEHHVGNLISWAEKAFDRSLNQPMLPYAIIVVNALEPDQKDAERWWDTSYSTNALSRLDLIVQGKDTGLKGQLPKLAKYWRDRGKQINTLEDLLLCYYSGFQIVCIPHARIPPFLISQQYRKLYQAIKEASDNAEKKRKSVDLLMTSDELDRYFEIALAHFSEKPDEPFNFLSSALTYNPINPTFKDHVLNLLVYRTVNSPSLSEATILQQTAPLVASCIFLDIFRQRYPYRGNSKVAVSGYIELSAMAEKEFYQKYWRCEATDSQGKRCANVASGHQKGHQTLDGKVFAAGDFASSFNCQKKKFQNQISATLDDLFKKQKRSADKAEETKFAAYLHAWDSLSRITEFWKSNHSMTCFCCLNSVPVHTLRCGHIICQYCLEDFSHLSDCGAYLCVSVCPLCYNVDDHWNPAWKTKLQYPTEGQRVLSLDGGGIRSIMQLTILELLEDCIDLGVPIQDFFDLIIGTSGGGIVAFGLGVQQLDVKICTEKFKELSWKAFKPRKGAGVPLWGLVVEARHHGKYETRGLEDALKSIFGHGPIFGTDQNHGQRLPTKVGVTTTSSNHHTYLLANYNRQAIEQSRYYSFFRAVDKLSELKVWEALRATSAAPTYFKSFFHEPSGHTFNDGGIKYNNPVDVADMEQKKLWPHLANTDPDILLSIGTGVEQYATTNRRDQPGPKNEAGFRGFAMGLIRLASDTIQDGMDSEKMWDTFLKSVVTPSGDDGEKLRKYRRLNAKFEDVPKLDQVERMAEFQDCTRRNFADSADIRSVAATLIATLFYLEEEPVPEQKQSPNHREYKGTIFCRLRSGSQQLKTLCKRLLNHSSRSPQLGNIFFRKFWDQNRDSYEFEPLTLDNEVFQSMCSQIYTSKDDDPKPFELPVSFVINSPKDKTGICMRIENQYISPCLNNESKYVSISGFPRFLEGQRHVNYSRCPLSRVNTTMSRRSQCRSNTIRSGNSSGTESSSTNDSWGYWRFLPEATILDELPLGPETVCELEG